MLSTVQPVAFLTYCLKGILKIRPVTKTHYTLRKDVPLELTFLLLSKTTLILQILATHFMTQLDIFYMSHV